MGLVNSEPIQWLEARPEPRGCCYIPEPGARVRQSHFGTNESLQILGEHLVKHDLRHEMLSAGSFYEVSVEPDAFGRVAATRNTPVVVLSTLLGRAVVEGWDRP